MPTAAKTDKSSAQVTTHEIIDYQTTACYKVAVLPRANHKFYVVENDKVRIVGVPLVNYQIALWLIFLVGGIMFFIGRISTI